MPNVLHQGRRAQSERVRELPVSLIRGGSFYRAQEKAGLIRPNRWDLQRRVPAAIAVTWLPLVVLSAAYGGLDDLLALLVDYRVYARLFVAIPLLLVGQITMDTRFREMGQHFLDANIVRIADLSVFHDIVTKARRLRDAFLPEMVIIVLVYIQMAFLLESERVRNVTWAIDAATNSLTPAGYYSVLVAQALFLGLMGVAVWKWMIWVYVLRRLSRMNLQLDATNGDLTAGLGFLGEVPRAFVPVVLAVASVAGANWRSQLVAGQLTLNDVKWPAVALAILTLLSFFLPLALFTPALLREKRRSILRYGSLQHRVSLRFRSKWSNQSNEQVDDLLAGPDASSLADLSSDFKSVEQMRAYPFRKSTVIAFLAALAVPLLPVLTTQIPLREVLRLLFDAVH
jgi:hypothetical protein